MPSRPRVLIIGPSLKFLSGVSVYTHQLVEQLGQDYDVSALLVRNLVPRRLYPGGRRVGKNLSSLSYEGVPHVEGLDWCWIGSGSLRRAFRFLDEQRPDVVVMQWWTAATAHSYLAIAAYAQRHGARVLVEYHEVQDPGEAGLPLLRRYGNTMSRLLARRMSGALVHHEHDRELLSRVVSLDHVPVRLAAHPPYTYLGGLTPAAPPELPAETDPSVFRMLFFGVIRPRKGFETVASAFSRLPRALAERMELLVVGECWEGLQAAVNAARTVPNGDRVRVVDRYVTDEEAAAVFGMSDLVLLPYTEASSSGPLAIARSFGLPMLYSDLGALRVSAKDYPAATPVAVADAEAWARAMAERFERWRERGTELTPTQEDWSPLRAAYAELVSACVSADGGEG